MLRAKTWLVMFAVIAGLVGASQPAGAVSMWTGTGSTQAVGGTGVNSLTVGGLTITATTCVAQIGGVSMTGIGGCSLLNLQMVVVAGTQPEIQITGLSGGAIFSTANTVRATNGTTYLESAGLDDLTLILTVTSSTKTVKTYGAILAGSVTGTGSAATKTAQLADISMGEHASPNPSGTSISGLSLSALPSGTYSGQVSQTANLSPAVGNFTVTKDIRLAPPAVLGGDTLVLSSVYQIFNTPEPVSMAVFAVGLGGLAAARRRRKNRAA